MMDGGNYKKENCKVKDGNSPGKYLVGRPGNAGRGGTWGQAECTPNL
jgi:hypothetical protein